MKRTAAHVAGLVALCGLSFAFGSTAHRFTPSTTVAAISTPERPAWTDVVAASRATADAGSLRAMALEALDAADTRGSVVQALELFGWVAQPGDESLLMAWADGEVQDEARAATLALGHLGTPDAVDGLVYLVRAVSRPADVHAAARGLAAMGTPSAARALADAFTNASGREAASLAAALGQFRPDGPVAFPALYEGIRQGDSHQRNAALLVLAQASDGSILPLLEEQSSTGSVPLRLGAIAALGALNHPSAVRVLKERLYDGNAEIVEAAGQALARSAVASAQIVLIDLVTDPQMAAKAVRWLPDAASPDAMTVLVDAVFHGSADVGALASARLLNHPWAGRPPSDVLNVAREVLSGRLRQAPFGAAATTLVAHGSRRDRSYAAGRIRDLSVPNRMRMVRDLGASSGVGRDEVLLALLEDPSASVQGLAAQSLIGRNQALDGRVQEILLARVENDGSNYVINALARLGTPAALDAVMRRVVVGTRKESRAAISALASGHPDRLVDALVDLDSDGQKVVWYSLLSSNPGPDLVELALESDHAEIQRQAIRYIPTMDPDQAVSRLMDLMASDDVTVRDGAISALGKVPDARVVDQLVALNEPVHSWSVASALSEMGTEHSHQALMTLAMDSSPTPVREAAIHHLGWSQADGALDVLSDCLDDPDPAVVWAAVRSLEEMGTTHSALRVAALFDETVADPSRSELASQTASVLERMGGEVATSRRGTLERANRILTDFDDFDFDFWEEF